MKNPNHWQEKKYNLANSKLPRCSAINYFPKINLVSTKITAKSDEFIPKYENADSSFAFIMACLEEEISLPPGGSALISCGFSIQISKGYKAKISIVSDLANKGLIIKDEFLDLDSSYKDEVKIYFLNTSDNLIKIYNKMKIAKIWAEQIFYFDWIDF